MKYTVSELYTFPVKSLRGNRCEQLTLDEFGPEHDRRWMLIDDDNHFLTQRQLHRMCLADVVVTEAGISLNAPGMPEIHVPHDCFADEVQVAVWKDTATGLLADHEVNAWLGRFLDHSVRLVYMPDKSFRPVDPQFRINSRNRVSFADGFPLLLTTTASLDDLNQRLGTVNHEPVPMTRFRPNLVVDNEIPFEEDRWKRIEINGIVFHVVKPCSRCIIPTIDINTAERSREPMDTLMVYRKRDNKVYFGQNLVHAGQGTIRTGDQVRILE